MSKKEKLPEALLKRKACKEEQPSGNQKKGVKFVDVIGNLRCQQHLKGKEMKPL